MAPIRLGDGTVISPKGIAEVRKGDGTILFSGINQSDNLPDNVVNRWVFGEGSGLTVSDSKGSLDAAYNELTWNDSFGNGGYHGEHDGSNDYGDLGTASRSDFSHFINSGVGAFGGWIQPHSETATQMIFGTDTDALQRGINSFVEDDGLKTIFYNGAGSQIINMFGGNIDSSKPQPFCVTLDGSNAYTYYGRDAAQVSSDSVSNLVSGDLENNVTIGAYREGTGLFFDGALDDLWRSTSHVTQTEFQDYINSTEGYYAQTNNYFASDGMSQPTHDIQAPEAVYAGSDNTTFFVHQGPNLEPVALKYDHDSGGYSGETIIGSNPLSTDDHGAPAVNLTSDGTIHAFWGSHNDPLKYAQSSNAYDTTSWNSQTDIGSDTTYPCPVVDPNDNIYLFVRERADDYGTTQNVPQTIYKSTDQGGSWTEIGPVIDFANQTTGSTDNRIYVMDAVKNGSDIHFVWHWYDPSDATRKKVYHAILDTTDDSLRSQDGTSLSWPIDKTAADNNCVVLSDESSGAGSAQISLVNGTPHVIFNHDNSGWEYQYSSWDGSAWTTPATITASGAQYGNGTLIANSSTDIDAYLAVSSDGDRGGDLEEWNYDGSSWGQLGTILSKSDSGEDIDNPKVVKPTRTSEIKIIFSQSDEGDYSNSDLELYAHGDSGFVKR